MTLPTGSPSPSENGHSRYGQLMARFARGCAKTRKSQRGAELFSLLPSSEGGRQCYSFLDCRNREGLSTRKLSASVFTQPGPLRDLASEVVHPPSRAISWTDLSPTACQADGIAVIRRAASPLLFSGGIWNHGAIAGFGWLFWRQRGVELSRSRPGPHYQADNLRGHLLANGHAARRQNTKIH